MSHYAETNGWARSFHLGSFKVNPDLNTCLGHVEAEYTVKKIIYESGPYLQVLLVLLQPFLRKMRKANFSRLFSHLVVSGSKLQKTIFWKNCILVQSTILISCIIALESVSLKKLGKTFFQTCFNSW